MRRSQAPSIQWLAPGRAPSATPALVAGIIAAAFPIVVTAALAWWLGGAARTEIDASDQQLEGRGFATAARVLAVYSLVATVAVAVTAVG
jgi:hypothetical protein